MSCSQPPGDYSPAFKIFIAGIGFASEAYDLFIINVTKRIMDEGVEPLSDAAASLVSSAALGGAIVGMLTFGSLADLVGRRLIFVVTLSCVIVGSFGSALCFTGGSVGIYTQLACWRALLGLGIGGEYAVAASVSSEASEAATRGRSISSVFAMQGVGNLMAAIVGVVLLRSGLSYDAMWRIALFLGGVPGLATIYWRVQMKESAAFEKVSAVTEGDDIPGTPRASSPEASRDGRDDRSVGAAPAPGSPMAASSSVDGGDFEGSHGKFERAESVSGLELQLRDGAALGDEGQEAAHAGAIAGAGGLRAGTPEEVGLLLSGEQGEAE